MNIVLKIILFIIIIVPVYAADVTITGTYLGGMNAIKQRNSVRQTQFDYAANVDINFVIKPEIAGVIQFQMSPGGSHLHFPGESIVVTDLNLSYSPKHVPWNITMGSFDTPFGQHVSRLSNNADTFNNMLLLNPLLYNAFAGPMGTLNTLGFMTMYRFFLGELTVAITNGTDESAYNSDGHFGVVARVISVPLFNNSINIGGSYMYSDDYQGVKESERSGFGADFSAGIMDFSIQFIEKFRMNAYIARLFYDDQNPESVDEVWSWMTETSYQRQKLRLSARISGWQPCGIGNNKIIYATNNTLTGKLPDPGFADSGKVRLDQDIYRYELGLDYFLTPIITIRSEIFWDDYRYDLVVNTDVLGVLGLVNVRF